MRWWAALLVVLVAGCAAPAVAPPGPAAPPAPARRFRLADSGIWGELYLPDHPAGRSRAVLVFGGSEGGDADTDVLGAALARQGFVALVIAYFAEPGLPPTLEDIPIEYFEKAARLLSAQPEVDRTQLAAWGVSRGTEAAVLLAAAAPQVVRGVVLESPSSVTNPGLSDHNRPAWTLAGHAVPTVPPDDFGIPDPADASVAFLPIARVTGPIVTICGELDRVWPSCPYATALVAHAGPGRITTLEYPHAGHAFVTFGLVADALGTPIPIGIGGAPQDNVDAGHAAFPRVVAALRSVP